MPGTEPGPAPIEQAQDVFPLSSPESMVEDTSADPPEFAGAVRHQPNGRVAGGLSFDSVGDGSRDTHWRALYASAPGESGAFYVFVRAGEGKFLVNGSPLGGVAFAGLVSGSPHFQEHAGESTVPVRLVWDGAGTTAADHSEVRAFADALGSPERPRIVEASTSLDDFVPVKTRLQPESITWKPLCSRNGTVVGMGSVATNQAWDVMASLSRSVADESLRVVAVHDDRTSKEEWTLGEWALATTGQRVRPVPLYLENWNGSLALSVTNGMRRLLSPEEAARLVFGSSLFGSLVLRRVKRPPLLLFISRADSSSGDMVNARFVKALLGLAGSLHVYDYEGPLEAADGWPVPRVPVGRVLGESVPSGVRMLVMDSVFGVPSSMESARRMVLFRDAVASGSVSVDGVARLSGRTPLFVVVDSVDGTFAEVAGEGGVVHEVGGGVLARLLRGNAEFESALMAEPGRPVVLVGARSGERVNFGGLGFDFAGELRVGKDFRDVFAVGAVAGADGLLGDGGGEPGLTLVSVLRAGDLKTDALLNSAGQTVAWFVRSPGDRSKLAAATRWGLAVRSRTMRTYSYWNGSASVEVPFGAEQTGDSGVGPPFLILAALENGGCGYHVERVDGAGITVSAAELARVLRADRGLRSRLSLTLAKPIALASLDGAVPDAEGFANELRALTYHRNVLTAQDAITLESGGRIHSGRAPFILHAKSAYPERSGAVLSYRPVVGERLDTAGMSFSADLKDAYYNALVWQEKRGAGTMIYGEVEDAGFGQDGSPLLRAVHHLTPWNDGVKSQYMIETHGTPEGMAVALTSDRPLQVGDKFTVPGATLATIVRHSGHFVDAHLDADTAVILLACRSYSGQSDSGAAASFARAWNGGLSPVFAATGKVTFGEGQSLAVTDGGSYLRVSAQPGTVPPKVPLSALVVSEFDAVAMSLGRSGTSVDQTALSELSAVADALVPVVWWRLRNGAPLPSVSIQARGSTRDGAAYGRGKRRRLEDPATAGTSAVRHELLRALMASAERYRAVGMEFDLSLIPIRTATSESAAGTDVSALVEVDVPHAELGQSALQAIPEFSQSQPEEQSEYLNTWTYEVAGAFQALSHSRRGEGHPPSENAAGGLSFNEGVRWDTPLWEALYKSLPATGEKEFKVMVTGVGRGFLVDGKVLGGEEFAEVVFRSPAFRNQVSNSRVPVRLVVMSQATSPLTQLHSDAFLLTMWEADETRSIRVEISDLELRSFASSAGGDPTLLP
ncbi:hypothetical protein Lesp01_81690 [Lentzea sp. NBRC 102530]|nr:hypothetical protein Lesp01_81690 [Lentzea sp. NBRC 102530]